MESDILKINRRVWYVREISKALDALAGFIYLIDYILILIIGYFGAVSIINKDYIKLLECFFFISVCLFLGILLNIIVDKVIL